MVSTQLVDADNMGCQLDDCIAAVVPQLDRHLCQSRSCEAQLRILADEYLRMSPACGSQSCRQLGREVLSTYIRQRADCAIYVSNIISIMCCFLEGCIVLHMPEIRWQIANIELAFKTKNCSKFGWTSNYMASISNKNNVQMFLYFEGCLWCYLEWQIWKVTKIYLEWKLTSKKDHSHYCLLCKYPFGTKPLEVFS